MRIVELINSKLLLLFLSLFPAVLSAITLNPSTFTVSNLNDVANGDTVYLESGVYNLTSNIISAWSSVKKEKVTFQSDGSGKVEMDGSSFSNMVIIEFKKWDNLLLKDIKFVNVEIQFDGCTNSTMDSLILTGQKFDHAFQGKGTFCIRVVDGANCTVKNTTVDWTFNGWNAKGIKVNGGTNHQFLDNIIKGRLIGAMSIITGKKTTTNVDPVTNHIVRGGYMIRTIPESEYIAEQEDHGIYVHNISHLTIDDVSFVGWTQNASGHGIKIKGANYIEVKNCKFNTSGIIIRVADNWVAANNHIWIHDNKLNDGDINSWTDIGDGFCIKNSCVIEGNTIYDGSINGTTEDAAMFNMFNDLANKDGGVYTNHTKTDINIKSGINQSGNDLDLSDTTTISVTGIMINPKSTVVDEGSTTTLSIIVFPLDATNKSVNWSSSDTLVASVSTAGVVTALSKGYTKITVTTMEGLYIDTCAVTVTCRPTAIIPNVQVNGGAWQQTSSITVNVGDKLTLSPLPSTGSWEWTGPNEYSSTSREVIFIDIQVNESGTYAVTCTNVCGEKSTLDFNVNVLTVDVNSFEFTDNLKINAYPNPFTTSIKLELGYENYNQARLLDITGRVLISEELNNENVFIFSLSYSEAPAGVYFIQLISSEEVKTIKVMRK